jgi:hypothetical protein
MSTRSSIAVLKADGTVEAVYCHFDGYLKGVGKTLKEYFATQAKAEELVDLGSLSVVAGAESLREVIAYSRDRGEPYERNRPCQYADIDSYFRLVGDAIGDNGYRYIFRDGKWQVWGDMELQDV